MWVLPASTQQRIVLKIKTSVEQLLNSDTEENNNRNHLGSKAAELPRLTEEEPQTRDRERPFQPQGPGKLDLEIDGWNCLNSWVPDDNHQSDPQDLSSIFFGEFPQELPHIPQHQLGWYGTAVDPSDTPEFDVYMYEPRRPLRLKIQQEDRGHADSL